VAILEQEVLLVLLGILGIVVLKVLLGILGIVVERVLLALVVTLGIHQLRAIQDIQVQ
jgi:hypothetical protein